MNETLVLYSCILLVGVFVSSVSQVMLKKAAMREYPSKIREYANPLVIVAYILFLGCTLITILAYAGIPLSWGPVLETTSYIYITIFGVVIFHEKITPKKIVALALIIIGILVYAFFG